MRLNPFARSGRHGQSPAEVRAERDRMAADKAELAARLKAADELIGNLVQERNWFHDRWIEAGQRAVEAETVVGCLEGQLAEERQKVADLEAIAGPHVPATETESPIYSEVTSEHPLPAFTEKYPAPDFSDAPAADSEDTVQLPLVKTLADALVDA